MSDRMSSSIVFLAVLAIHVVVANFIGNNGWDDGAITLAFAKTFAQTGKIALTAQSAQVEGFSSPLWFWLLAGLHRVFDPGFDGFIRIAQLLSGLFSAISACVFFNLSRQRIGKSAAALLAIALFVSAPFLNETMNGMEMGCLGLFALLIVHQLDSGSHRQWLLIVLAAAMVLTRFEAGPYVIGAAVLMALFRSPLRTSLHMVLGAAAGIVATLIFRLYYFGAWVPNTVLAKRWEPYHEPGFAAFVGSRVHSGTEVVLPYFFVISGLLLGAFFQRRERLTAGSSTRQALRFAGAYLLLVWLLNLAIGKNWGYTARMQLSAVPVMFWLLVMQFDTASGRRALGAKASAALALVTVLGSAYFIQRNDVMLAITQWRGLPVPDGVTPASFRATGEAVDGIRMRLQLPRISFVTSDVGGSSLCCDKIEIIDSGLLTDHFLAVNGYAAFGRYLADRKPDVIETHEPWSTLSGIYQSPYFRDNYRPVVMYNTWLYVRKDLVSRLGASRSDSVASDGTRARYRGDATGDAFISKNSLVPLFLK